jgi:hypothetical protein
MVLVALLPVIHREAAKKTLGRIELERIRTVTRSHS